MTKAAVVLIGALLSSLAPLAAQAAEARDEAGVRAVEQRWSEAFLTGDGAVLDALLDPAYVSVSATGKARGKAEIIANAAAYAAQHPGGHASPLPPTSTIRIIGEAAVVQHHGPGETSVDVFYYRGGHWLAWYSQHTSLAPT